MQTSSFPDGKKPNWQPKPGWLHVVGIGGVVLAPLANAYQQRGYNVTGSDEQLFGPTAAYLRAQPDIKVMAKFDFNNLTWARYSGNPQDKWLLPEFIIAGGGLSEQNRELQFARKRGVKVFYYAQLFASELVVPGNSIVVAGSFGKTSTTALLVSILQNAGQDPSYMFGALVPSLGEPLRLKSAGTKISVVEGDEYITGRSDMQSKFFHYQPDKLLLTGYAYDHTDVFTTPESYYENFAKLVALLPETGLLVYNARYPELVKLAELAKCQKIAYDYSEESAKSLLASLEINLLGQYQRENVLAALTMAKELGVEAAALTQGIAKVTGIYRRMQIVETGKFKSGKSWTIIDDFGATPAKAKESINSVRANFPGLKLNVLFEPNIGTRTQQALESYLGVFTDVDKLLLPPFAEVAQEGIVSNQDLGDFLISKGELASKLKIVGDKAELLHNLTADLDTNQDQVFLFLSSHAVEDFIDDLDRKLREL